jgi:hypothetical protein
MVDYYKRHLQKVVSYHEAGHACAEYFLCKHRDISVVLNFDGKYCEKNVLGFCQRPGLCWGFKSEYLKPNTVLDRIRRIIVLIAGDMVELIWLYKHGYLHFYPNVIDLAQKLEGLDRKELLKLIHLKKCERLYENPEFIKAYQLINKIVQKYWINITNLAKALYIRGTCWEPSCAMFLELNWKAGRRQNHAIEEALEWRMKMRTPSIIIMDELAFKG